MRSEEVLQREIERVCNRYTGNLDIECAERLRHQGYIEGIKFALGERERHNEPIPPEPAINSIVREIRNHYHTATMNIERVANPGSDVESEKVTLNIELDAQRVIARYDEKSPEQQVADMKNVEDHISDIVRSVDEDAPYMLYTHFDWDR